MNISELISTAKSKLPDVNEYKNPICLVPVAKETNFKETFSPMPVVSGHYVVEFEKRSTFSGHYEWVLINIQDK